MFIEFVECFGVKLDLVLCFMVIIEIKIFVFFWVWLNELEIKGESLI